MGRTLGITVVLAAAMVFSSVASTGSPQAALADSAGSPRAESAAVLLEKGIFNEDTKGDLDAAVMIYKKIIDDAKANRKYVAEAHYRLGICLMKQKKNADAVVVFRKLIADFADHEKFVARARKHIAESRKRITGQELAKIVEDAVMTISTCAVTDPQVKKSLASLAGLNEQAVVKAVAKFLDSKKNTIRRSAIYILWKGEFAEITPAVPGLTRVCKHEEDLTRGMAALALGGRKIDSAFQTLCEMTLKDQSHFARRCAAYALGLMGRLDAKPVLEKALKDENKFVRNNAEAALTMLAKVKSTPQARLPLRVIAPIVDLHMEAYKRAQAKGLPVNTHIYGVDDKFNKYFGGFLTYKNMTGRALDEEIPLGNFSHSHAMELFGEQGAPQKFRFEKRATTQLGKYRLWWKPDRPVQPGEVRLLGYLRKKTQKLPKLEGGHRLKMKNHFGSPVLENFFLVIPNNVTIAKQSRDYILRKRIGMFDVYQWQREVPNNTTNAVNVILKKVAHAHGEFLPLNKVVERTVYDDGAGKDCFIDLDIGKLYSHPKDTPPLGKEAVLEWLKDRGIDAKAEARSEAPGLWGFEMVVIPISEKIWKNADAEEVVKALVSGLMDGKASTPAIMSALGKLPRSFAFKTREGSVGVLQILQVVNKKPGHINIRYKLLEHGTLAMRESVSKEDMREAENLAAEGWRLWRAKKLAEAEVKFKQAVRKNPTNANAWNGLGWSQFNQGKPANAKLSFEKAVAIESKHSAALNGLGWIAKGQGNTNEAIGYWKKAVAAAPTATAALSGLATTYMELKRYDEAAKYYQMWLKVEPKNKDAKAGLEKAKAAIDATGAATTAAEKWVSLVDQGKYAESWDTANGGCRGITSSRIYEADSETL